MGHDGHFLSRLDRVSPRQTELALSLYRDHELVRELLTDEAVPEGADRVAFALDDEGGIGPHIVVARSGAFVTCLGRGMMPFGLPVLSRARIDAAIASNADVQARLDAWLAVTRPNAESLFLPMVTKMNMLGREEARALSLFAPLYAPMLYDQSVRQMKTHVEGFALGRRQLLAKLRSPAGARAHARSVWLIAHAFEAAGMVGEPMQDIALASVSVGAPFTVPCLALMDRAFFLRGVWASARVGGPVVDSALASVEGLHDVAAADAIGALLLTALTTPSREREIERALERVVDSASEGGDFYARARMAREALGVLRGPRSADAVLAAARELHSARTRSTLPPGDPDRLDDPASCPHDLAATTALVAHGSIMNSYEALASAYQTLPLLVGADEGVFHYPERVVQKLLSPWGPKEAVAHGEQMLEGVAALEPVRVEAKPGRNEPCACGSGKKAKRCCAL